METNEIVYEATVGSLSLTVRKDNGLFYCHDTGNINIFGAYGNSAAEAIGYYFMKKAFLN